MWAMTPYYGILLFPVTLALTGILVKHSNVLRGMHP